MHSSSNDHIFAVDTVYEDAGKYEALSYYAKALK